jgi:hypothetical protein
MANDQPHVDRAHPHVGRWRSRDSESGSQGSPAECRRFGRGPAALLPLAPKLLAPLRCFRRVLAQADPDGEPVKVDPKAYGASVGRFCHARENVCRLR